MSHFIEITSTLYEKSVSYILSQENLTKQAVIELKRQIVFYFCIFAAVLACDQLVKLWVVYATTHAPDLLGSFEVVRNKGFVFGSMSDGHPHLRITLYASLLGPILSSYCLLVLDYFRARKHRFIGTALTLFAAGIVSNVADKLLQGAVIDFIPLHLGGGESIIFNLADVFQISGAIGIVWFIGQKNNFLEIAKELRQTLMVDKRFQFFYAIKVTLLCLFLALNLGLFSSAFLRAYPLPDSFKLLPYISSFAMITGAFSVTAFILSFRFSNRIVGPIFALERYIDDLQNGKDVQFQLRERDHLHRLKRIAEKIQCLAKRPEDTTEGERKEETEEERFINAQTWS